MTFLQDKIAKVCISKFLKLGKLPLNKEFTILSGIVLEYENNNQIELECVSIGTGMKCLSLSKLDKQGQYLTDCHAEIVTRRAFIKFLTIELTKLITQKKSNYFKFNFNTKKFEFNNNIKSINFYCSQAPCGDASLEALDEVTTDTRVQPANKKQKLNNDTNKSDEESAVRGRSNFQLKGKCRTKPGRIDSEPSNCMSCSDKLALWNLTGIQGPILGLLMDPIYIDRFVIGELYNIESLKRALITRLKSERIIEKPFKLNDPELLSTTLEFKFSRYREVESNADKLKSSAHSLNWHKHITNNKPELIVKGLKQGSKLNYPNNLVPVKNRSELCPQNLSKSLYTLISLAIKEYDIKLELPSEKLNYRDFKLLNPSHEEFKKSIKASELKGWDKKSEDYYKFEVN